MAIDGDSDDETCFGDATDNLTSGGGRADEGGGSRTGSTGAEAIDGGNIDPFGAKKDAKHGMGKMAAGGRPEPLQQQQGPPSRAAKVHTSAAGREGRAVRTAEAVRTAVKVHASAAGRDGRAVRAAADATGRRGNHNTVDEADASEEDSDTVDGNHMGDDDNVNATEMTARERRARQRDKSRQQQQAHRGEHFDTTAATAAAAHAAQLKSLKRQRQIVRSQITQLVPLMQEKLDRRDSRGNIRAGLGRIKELAAKSDRKSTRLN